MKIIITGATGSLGAYLTRYFSRQGHEIIASGRMKNPPMELLRYASYHQADICQRFTFPDADVCIHAAALPDDKSMAKDLYSANVDGTKHVAQASKNCTTFIQISSSSVYLPADVPIVETIAGNQNDSELSPYGLSKLQAETMLSKNSKHPSCFMLRPKLLYGIGDKMIIPRMLRVVINDVFYRPGKMEVNLSMTHYSNLCKAIDCCLSSEKKGQHIYNVADEMTYRLIDVFKEITQQLYGEHLKEQRIPIWLLKGLALFHIGGITPLFIKAFTQNSVLDVSKIKNELNYSAQANLLDSMPDITNWVHKIGGVERLKTGAKSLAWEGL